MNKLYTKSGAIASLSSVQQNIRNYVHVKLIFYFTDTYNYCIAIGTSDARIIMT